MEEATTTEPTTEPTTETPVAQQEIIIQNSDVMLPLETSISTSSDPNINSILDNYFTIFPSSYLLVLMGIAILSVLIYTLYSYLDE